MGGLVHIWGPEKSGPFISGQTVLTAQDSFAVLCGEDHSGNVPTKTCTVAVLSPSMHILTLPPSSFSISSTMKSFFSSNTTVTYTFQIDNNNSPPQAKTTEIPIDTSSSSETPVSVTVHLPTSQSSIAAAIKIQSAYRSHRIRSLVKIISAVNSEANRLERLIQRQETVDAIRSDDREKIRMNEALMALLLRLDSVPGIDPSVRELRRSVSRRIVGLQEILDAVADSRVEYEWDWFLRNWDEEMGRIEEGVCRERGGEEMERFCAEKLGFRCLERFLRGP